jgi:hypothetical protein
MVLLGLLLVALAAGLIFALVKMAHHSRLLEFAVICAVGGVAAISIGFRNLVSRLHVCVFPAGLAYVAPEAVRICLWEEIASLFRIAGTSHRRPKSASSRLVFFSGPALVLRESRIERMGQLVDLIEAEAFRRQLPVASATLQVGGTVSFGPLSVSAAGIHKGKNLLPWAEATQQVAEGRLRLRRKGGWRKWCDVPVSEVPNLKLFLAIFAAYAKSQAHPTEAGAAPQS